VPPPKVKITNTVSLLNQVLLAWCKKTASVVFISSSYQSRRHTILTPYMHCIKLLNYSPAKFNFELCPYISRCRIWSLV